MDGARAIPIDEPQALTADEFCLELARALARAEARAHHEAEQSRQVEHDHS